MTWARVSPRRTRSLSGKRTESNHAAPSGNRRAEPTHPEPFVSHPEAIRC